jgi:NADH-quinone oxidoreductase subunit J
VLFYLCAAVVAISAVCVVLSKNIVRTALSLLFTLLGVAGLYLVLHAEFLAAVQLVVYAGGTLILIVFGIMLTSFSTYRLYSPRRIEVVVGLAIGLLFLVALVTAFRHAGFNRPLPLDAGAYSVDILGRSLLGDYLVPFELISVLLLAVMIGAAYLAKGRKHSQEEDGR